MAARVSPLVLRANTSFASSSSSRGLSRAFSLTSASDVALPSVVLYQYAICPYCHLTKAAMGYANVAYKAVEVNPLTKAEIKWSKDYRKVPIATMDGEQLNGSELIVQKVMEHPAVASNLKAKLKDMSKEVFVDSEESRKWVDFARDDLASLLYPNICSTWNDAYLAFGYVKDVDTYTSFQKLMIQNVGSLAMYFAASKIKQKRNITNEKEALNEVLVRFENEGLGNGKRYLSGTEAPNLGDIAVYGTLRSIEGLPAHAEILKARSAGSPLPSWYERMKSQVDGN